MNKMCKEAADKVKDTPTLVIKKKSPVRGKPIPIGKAVTIKSATKTQLLTDKNSVKNSVPSVKNKKPLTWTPKVIPVQRKETPASTMKLEKRPVAKLQKPPVTVQQCKNLAPKIIGRPQNFKSLVPSTPKAGADIKSLRKGMQNVKISSKCKEVNLQTDEIYFQTEQEIISLNLKINSLEEEIKLYQNEIDSKQMEINFLEEMITMRDGLCQDLQTKLSETETKLKESANNLELIKSHHNLALEANESIRKEYRAEIDTLKHKLEDEKQQVSVNNKKELEELKQRHELELASVTAKYKEELKSKDIDTTTRIEHFQEKCREQLRLCEIQYDQRIQSIQEQFDKLQTDLNTLEEKNRNFEILLQNANCENDELKSDLQSFQASKTMAMDCSCENEINKFKAELTKVNMEKHKFDIALMIAHDTVNIISQRLHHADQEVENLEHTVRNMENEKQNLHDEVENLKTQLNSISEEAEGYKESLVNILKSKSNLAKEHNRIMEHNISMIDSLTDVEREAYKELGSIKNELLADIDDLKLDSKKQIEVLQKEASEWRTQCLAARTEAADTAKQCSELLQHAEIAIQQMEHENQSLALQIQDQALIASELLSLRDENEKLLVKLAEQNSVIEQTKIIGKIQKEPTIKSPISFGAKQKSQKFGKENSTLTLASPLKERNY